MNAEACVPRRVVLALGLLALLAFALRTWRIEDFQIGPDDGSYLHSALVQDLRRSWNPLAWVREDVAWVRHLVDHYAEESVTYQHSYLHQFTARWLYRLGLTPLAALRTSSALTGAATVWIVGLWLARTWPTRRGWALVAAACVAFAPLHAFYSRTGWGQVGMAAFWCGHTAVLYRVLYRIEDGDARGFRRAGWALAAFSLLAFGWQEGVAPYLAGASACVMAAPLLCDADARVRPRLLSRRTWTFVWSSIPVGAATLALKLWSPFAQKYWFNPAGRGAISSWSELKRLTWNNLVDEQQLHVMIGPFALILGVAGFFVAWRVSRSLAGHVALAALTGSLILFAAFGDAFLVRIYMPLWVAAIASSGVALAALGTWLAPRAGHLVAALVVAGGLGVQATVTTVTLFGDVRHPLFVQRLYTIRSKGDTDLRDVDRPILDRLRAERRPGERVTVFADKGAMFRLNDLGIDAREDYFEGRGPEWPDWPRWIVGVRNVFERSPFCAPNGAYEFVVGDTVGRWGLYRRRDP